MDTALQAARQWDRGCAKPADFAKPAAFCFSTAVICPRVLCQQLGARNGEAPRQLRFQCTLGVCVGDACLGLLSSCWLGRDLQAAAAQTLPPPPPLRPVQ